jgi:hypothetical protein
MKYILIAAAVIIAIFIVALQFIPIGIEPLTEVYFENHTQLPNVIFLNTPYDFSFTVHNLEYIPMNYSYNVTAEYLGNLIPVESGKFSLENNQTTTINESFEFSGKFQRAKIQIVISRDFENTLQKDPNLKNQTIDIHFWVNEYIPTGGVVV